MSGTEQVRNGGTFVSLRRVSLSSAAVPYALSYVETAGDDVGKAKQPSALLFPCEGEFMKWILWLNTVAEAAIAVGMFTMPGSFFPGAEGLAASIARAFSFAILAVAFISFSISSKATSPETLKNGVMILVFYHVFQLIAQFVNGAMFPPMLIPPVVIHTVFSTLFIAYLFKLSATGNDRKH